VRFQVSLPTPTADEHAHKCRPRFGHSRGPRDTATIPDLLHIHKALCGQ
jgi:hypothetical protein